MTSLLISGGPNLCVLFFFFFSSLKSVVFGLSLSLPLLVGEGGGLVCKLVGKANLLSDYFDSKQSVDLPLTCKLSLSLTTFAFRSSEVKRLVRLGPLWGH